MIRTARRAGLAALVLAPVVALVVACAPTPTPAPAPAPAPETPSVPSTPAAPTGTPVTFTCAEALPAGSVGSWAISTAAFTPEAGSDAAQAVALDGIACEFLDANGDTLVISIAQPSAESLPAIQQAAATDGTSTTALGGQEGYFDINSGTALANVFAGGYWISAQTSTWSADTDAAPVFEQVINVLPAG